MFTEGNILYFTPFYFRNGNPAKTKYFIVLKTVDEKSILASLPTRKNFIPLNNATENGCIELPDINFNCFVFSNSCEVTTCNKKFDFTTYVFGNLIDTHDINLMKDIYRNEGSDYVIWGKMKDDIFFDLILCLASSDSVKMKHKRMLGF